MSKVKVEPPDLLCACLHCGFVAIADFLIPYKREDEDNPPPAKVDGAVFLGKACPTCNRNKNVTVSEYRMLYR